MRNYKVITVMFDGSLKNKIFNLMHKLGLVLIAHHNPIFDRDGSLVGATATIKGDKAALWLISRIYKNEAVLEPIKLERKMLRVI